MVDLYHFLGDISFTSFQSQSILTSSIMIHLHLFGYDSFASFQSPLIHTISVMICSHSFGYGSFALCRSQPIRNLSITTHSQPFGHNHLHSLGYDPFPLFWSHSQHFHILTIKIHHILSATTCSKTRLHLFGHDTFKAFHLHHVCIPWILTRSYLLDQHTFVPLRLRSIDTP